MNAIAQTQLAAYRSRHPIRSIRVADKALGSKSVCETDGIRVHAIRHPGRWRHDQAEIRAIEEEAAKP